MLRLTELKLPLDHDEAALREAAAGRLGVAVGRLGRVEVARRGCDARKRSAVCLVYTLDVAMEDGERLVGPGVAVAPALDYRFVARAPEGFAERPVVVGAGPCGLFAGLMLARMGFRPIILERGQPVRVRTRDTWGLWRRGVLDPESNVQFGEGGAGTFSDGKLWSGIRDPLRLGRRVLTEFVAAGAPEEILTLAKPHIGTFRLVSMVERMRATIEALGGEYRFGARVVGLELEPVSRAVRGVRLHSGEVVACRQVVLAVGHSARDTVTALHGQGVAMEAKAFSIGVRIEHPQGLIDRARFGGFAGHARLGAADYKLVHHCEGAAAGRSVYSFCMCPGGQVVAAASEPGHLATNGMSQYSRAERNANAGIVVGVQPADFPTGVDPALAGYALQRRWEAAAFVAGGGDYRAPAQRVGDFLAGRASEALGDVVPSYQPGVRPSDLATCLPEFVAVAIRQALPRFERQIPGFAMADAVLTGVETRTSSPVRISRGAGLASTNTPGLYPAGEGGGFAGGILSAGVDGIRVAEAVALEALLF